jgi:FAD binding domain
VYLTGDAGHLITPAGGKGLNLAIQDAVELGLGLRERYCHGSDRPAMAECGGRCPIEAGVLGRLADHECRHGQLPGDRTPACGCWPLEGAAILGLPRWHAGFSSMRRVA